MFTRQSYKFSLFLLLSCALTAVSLPLKAADSAPDQGRWLQVADAGPSITKSQAAQAAQRRHGGKVLSVTRSGDNYRVKLLQDSGKVIIVLVDGKTGKAN